MSIEDTHKRVLEHLKKISPTNTFRLARELKIDRHTLLTILEQLYKKQTVDLRSGNVKFLKFPSEDKAPSEQKAKSNESPAQSDEDTKFLGSFQSENNRLKEKLSELESGIKKMDYTKSNKFREQAQLIVDLEKKVKALQEKAKTSKIIIREVPKVITKTVIKEVIKKVPTEPMKKNPASTSRFKLANLARQIQNLEIPCFLEQKIRCGKLDLTGLNKSIQQVHIPDVLRSN